ncbi:MAG: hypothetical protein G8237_03745 [Magnetococcales bacterium]|nr:hypothetical protein [Magnetococcales bacterium]
MHVGTKHRRHRIAVHARVVMGMRRRGGTSKVERVQQRISGQLFALSGL